MEFPLPVNTFLEGVGVGPADLVEQGIHVLIYIRLIEFAVYQLAGPGFHFQGNLKKVFHPFQLSETQLALAHHHRDKVYHASAYWVQTAGQGKRTKNNSSPANVIPNEERDLPPVEGKISPFGRNDQFMRFSRI